MARPLYRLLSFFISTIAIAFAVYFSWKLFLYPSRDFDKAFALIADHCDSDDMPELSSVTSKIQSDWWREYLLSRLAADRVKEGKLDELKLGIKHQDLLAYLYANYLVGRVGEMAILNELNPKDKKFAVLLFNILNNAKVSNADVLHFKDKFFSKSQSLQSKYYGKILISAAIRKKRFDLVEPIANIFEMDLLSYYEMLILQGVPFEQFSAMPKAYTDLFKSCALSLEKLDAKAKQALLAKIKSDLNFYKDSYYWRRGLAAQMLMNLGEKSEAYRVIEKVYTDSLTAPHFSKRVLAREIAITFFARNGDLGMVEYMLFTAPNYEESLKLLPLVVSVLSENGNSKAALELCEDLFSLKGRLRLHFNFSGIKNKQFLW